MHGGARVMRCDGGSFAPPLSPKRTRKQTLTGPNSTCRVGQAAPVMLNGSFQEPLRTWQPKWMGRLLRKH